MLIAHGRAARRGVAALEFAMVAPLTILVALSVVDGARLLLIRAQIHNAANAIAQAAEKLSAAAALSAGGSTTNLTPDQMQQAMSVIYAEIPGLNLGNGGGLFPGGFAVTLSGVGYSPSCTAAVGCGTQTAAIAWSTALTQGGAQLSSTALRACSAPGSVTRFADDPGTQYGKMINPAQITGGLAVTLPPQIVADVKYSFTPYFPLFFPSTTLIATATMPAPLGNLAQAVTVATSGGTSGVSICA